MSNQPKIHRRSIPVRDRVIEQLPGLSEPDCAKLQQQGITTIGQLLKRANSRQSQQVLANQLQIKAKYVHKWVALADLARVPSIGCEYCGLLLHAGIISVKQLAQTPTHKLHQQLLRLQVATMQRRDLSPTVDQVAAWIQQARMLVKE
jgi:predicted flap endonuclease-1-like 5' DNA nuclease